MFELKPDYERSKLRIEAFWEGELIDRPLVQFHPNIRRALLACCNPDAGWR
jgi:hypothetical protein